MINPFKEVNWSPGKVETRKFAVSLMVGFPILAALLMIAGRLSTGSWELNLPLKIASIGISVGAVSWLLPRLARPLYMLWFFLGCCIGIVMGNLLLILLYYCFVCGTGLLLRLFGRCPISKTPDKSAKTYWTDVPPVADTRQYLSQF